jgi:hypothetical protein
VLQFSVQDTPGYGDSLDCGERLAWTAAPSAARACAPGSHSAAHTPPRCPAVSSPRSQPPAPAAALGAAAAREGRAAHGWRRAAAPRRPAARARAVPLLPAAPPVRPSQRCDSRTHPKAFSTCARQELGTSSVAPTLSCPSSTLPATPSLKPMDLMYLSALSAALPVLPVVAKADAHTSAELAAYRAIIARSLQAFTLNGAAGAARSIRPAACMHRDAQGNCRARTGASADPLRPSLVQARPRPSPRTPSRPRRSTAWR